MSLTDLALSSALECLTAHPELHAHNRFAHDVAEKYRKYGSLSPAQVSALTKSLQTDHDRATEAAESKGDAPEGRVTVTGEVLSIKEKENNFGSGTVLKMMVKLENKSRVWVSVPPGAGLAKGDIVTFTATFKRSADDRTFAFGSRPVLVEEGTEIPAKGKPTVGDMLVEMGEAIAVESFTSAAVTLVNELLEKPESPAAAGPSVLEGLLNELLGEEAAS